MLYIMRHGQTDWNRIHKLQGRTDIQLNEYGRQKAVEASEKVASLPIDVCFVSPLSRARETLELALSKRTDIETLPISVDERLIELNFGEYEGIEGALDDPSIPVYYFFKEPEKYQVSEGAESLEELYKRTGEFLSEVVIPLLKEGKNVFIVGHGAMNLSMINRIYNIPIKDYWKKLPRNCEIVEIENELVIGLNI